MCLVCMLHDFIEEKMYEILIFLYQSAVDCDVIQQICHCIQVFIFCFVIIINSFFYFQYLLIYNILQIT